MSLQLPFGVRVLNPFPVEDKYLNNGVPYTGTSQVNSLLAVGVRHTGLTVNINRVEYWYATGVTNSSLVVKSPSVVSGGGVTGATNGIVKYGSSKVGLGGSLTGATTIGLGVNSLTLSGTTGTLKYATDQSANYTKRSLVDKGYVTGITSTISVPVTGATNGLSVKGKNVVLGGTLTGDTTVDGSAYNLFLGGLSGLNSVSLNGLQGITLYTNNSNVSSTAANGDVSLGSNSGGNFATFNVSATNGQFKITDGRTGTNKQGVIYANDYSANFVPRSLVDKGYVTGLTTTSGVQTANNGLTKSGTNVHLGGSLTGDTTISGSSYQFNLGGNAGLSQINLKSTSAAVTTTSGDVVVTSGNDINLFPAHDLLAIGTHNVDLYANNQVQLGASNHQITLNPSGLDISQAASSTLTIGSTSNIVLNSGTNNIDVTLNGSGKFEYAADYSANYVARSIPDKAYVDSIAAGFDPKQAVYVATTVALTGATYHATGGTTPTGSFTSAPTIVDGKTVSNGNRVLVKNQSDPRQNGIYTVISSGTWYRSSDLDGTPAAEVASGDFLFVQTGATLAATGWVLTGNGVLTINTDPLNFVQFSAANSYIAGSGISIVGNTISNLHTYSNGLTKTINNVTLGGNLSSDVDIEGNSGNTAGFYIGQNLYPVNLFEVIAGSADYSNTARIDMRSSRARLHYYSGVLKSRVEATATGVHLYGGNPDGAATKTQIDLGSASTGHSFLITDSRSTQYGIEYAANYSSNFTPRSLVDKAYVTGITSSMVLTNGNGTTANGTAVDLGGTLSQDTFIDGSYSLNLGSSNLVAFNVTTSNPGATGLDLRAYSTSGFVELYTDNDVNVMYLQAQDGGITNEIRIGTFGIQIDGTTGFGGATYASDYSANFTSRSLVDKAYVTGFTASATTFTGAYVTSQSFTATTAMSFIGVSATTTGVTIYLPSTPAIYKPYTVSDIAGDAFMDNIIVNGNGKLIQGSSTAVLNTDYGSITFVYNGFSWSVTAIV